VDDGDFRGGARVPLLAYHRVTAAAGLVGGSALAEAHPLCCRCDPARHETAGRHPGRQRARPCGDPLRAGAQDGGDHPRGGDTPHRLAAEVSDDDAPVGAARKPPGNGQACLARLSAITIVSPGTPVPAKVESVPSDWMRRTRALLGSVTRAPPSGSAITSCGTSLTSVAGPSPPENDASPAPAKDSSPEQLGHVVQGVG
jgi:hypothetical protein